VSRLLSIPFIVVALCASACNPALRVDAHTGEAQRDAIARLTADPDAAYRNLDGPSGLDPLTAEKVVEKYEKKQGKSERPSSNPSIIQISSGGSNR
jgi:hypothetical protein